MDWRWFMWWWEQSCWVWFWWWRLLWTRCQYSILHRMWMLGRKYNQQTCTWTFLFLLCGRCIRLWVFFLSYNTLKHTKHLNLIFKAVKPVAYWMMVIVMIMQILLNVTMIEVIVVDLMSTNIIVFIVSAMFWTVQLHLIWLAMDTAMMNPIMKIVILMVVTAAELAQIQNIVLIVCAMQDHQRT